jgi:hypothetical protein
MRSDDTRPTKGRPRSSADRRSQLRCGSCGLGYSAAALTRAMALTTGVSCRRCGGTLGGAPEQQDRVEPRPVVAARSPVIGSERLPYA